MFFLQKLIVFGSLLNFRPSEALVPKWCISIFVLLPYQDLGEMAERLNALVLKTSKG